MSPRKPKIFTFCKRSLPAPNQIDLATEAPHPPVTSRWPRVCYLTSVKLSFPHYMVDAVTLRPKAVRIQSGIICAMPSAQSPQAPTHDHGSGGVWQGVVGKRGKVSHPDRQTILMSQTSGETRAWESDSSEVKQL